MFFRLDGQIKLGHLVRFCCTKVTFCLTFVERVHLGTLFCGVSVCRLVRAEAYVSYGVLGGPCDTLVLRSCYNRVTSWENGPRPLDGDGLLYFVVDPVDVVSIPGWGSVHRDCCNLLVAIGLWSPIYLVPVGFSQVAVRTEDL